jgi:penicillin-binding protein 2
LTGIDLPQERRGILPSRQWKRDYRGRAWYPGDTINVGIGQGFFLATPLQLAHATATIASKGKRYRPHLVKTVLGENTREIEPELVNEVEVADDDWDDIHIAMHDVIHSLRGTARGLSRNSTYELAGKSGTAQVVGIAQDAEYDSEELSERLRDHALFVSFAPYENPQIAVAVIIENGEGGSTVAGPVAKQVMDTWLLDDSGQLKEEFQ